MTKKNRSVDFDDEFGEPDDEFVDEFDAELDDEDESEEDDEAFAADIGDELGAEWQDEGYRVVDLSELAAAGDLGDDEPFAPRPKLAVDELLQRLIADREGVPANEFFALANLARSSVEMVRRLWPTVPVERRREVTETLVIAGVEWPELVLGPFLRVAVDDHDPVVRRVAVEGLVEDGEIDLLGRFVHLLDVDDAAEVRAAAAAALGSYVLAGELEEMDATLAMRAEQALMAALANGAESLLVQCRALESIAYSGEVGVRQLIEDAYYSPVEEMRLSALIAMGHSADIRWRKLARAELDNPSPAMRAEAAFACGELEAKSALPELLDLLEDEEQMVRLAVISALGHIGGKPAKTALRAIAASSDEVEAFAAEEALEEMAFYGGPEAAVAPLYDEADVDAWDDDDDDLGEYA